MKLKLLLEEKTAESIYHSDYEDLDALIKADRTGRFICKAGEYWEKFDYKKGLDALIKIDKSGGYVYNAGRDWGYFDYEKGLDVLKKKKDKYYYNRALENWPKGIEVSKEISKGIKDKAKKMTGKKYKL